MLIYFDVAQGVVCVASSHIVAIEEQRPVMDCSALVHLSNGKTLRVQNSFDSCQDKLISTDTGTPTVDTTKLRQLREACSALLAEEAAQLERWAEQSERGGWSTHQVRPMRERAQTLRERADKLELWPAL